MMSLITIIAPLSIESNLKIVFLIATIDTRKINSFESILTNKAKQKHIYFPLICKVQQLV